MKHKKTLKCKDHPKYKAIYQPKADCVRCYKMYCNSLLRRLYILRGDWELL